jgi:hypothetical protein
MSWELAQNEPSEQLAQLHFFSMVKKQANGEIPFRIVIREHATPQQRGMRFFAEADRQTNQNTVPYTPCGWGPTLLEALSQCITAIHRFPYEGPLPNDSGRSA